MAPPRISRRSIGPRREAVGRVVPDLVPARRNETECFGLTSDNGSADSDANGRVFRPASDWRKPAWSTS